jgi:hypothetical protein
MVTLTEDNVNELLVDLAIPYLSVKAYRAKLTNASKGLIAEREEKLDTILW